MEVDGLGSMLIAELVDAATKLMVTIVSATIVDVVARVVGQHLGRGIDARAIAVASALGVECESLIG